MAARGSAGDAGRVGGREEEGVGEGKGGLVGGWDKKKRYRKGDAAAPSPLISHSTQPENKTAPVTCAQRKHPAVCARPREGPTENGESVQKAAMHDREARLSAGT